MLLQMRAAISSKTCVPYHKVGCGFSLLIVPPNRTHVIVNIDNKGTAKLHKFVREIFLELEGRRNYSDILDLKLRPHYATIVGDGYATIRISVGLLKEDLTSEWHGVYGSATEVINIVEKTCSKYEKLANTEKRSGYKNFTCLVTGPRRHYVKGVFFLRFESNEAYAIPLTKEALEKRIITGIGQDITGLLIKVLNATC
ncbi:unnamed protein product [Dicrocoelium dendriticum]|nr:unnamed protein product [Dicrocoelium dendriticum]